MKKPYNKIVFWNIVFGLVTILLCIIYAVYYYYMSKAFPLHADDAYQGVYVYNLLTEGNERIYRLNLNYNTLVFIVCYFIKGISIMLPYLSYAIIYSNLILLVIVLSHKERDSTGFKICTLSFVFYIMGCVSQKGVLIFQAHMDIVIMLYISLLALCYLRKEPTSLWKRIVAYLVVYFAISSGILAIDFIFYIIAIVPLFLVEIVELVKNKRRTDAFVLGILSFAVFSSKLIETIKNAVLNVMARNPGEHSNTVIFGNFDTMQYGFRSFIQALLHMFNASFFDNDMMQLNTVFWGINCLIIIFGVVLVFKSIIDFVRFIRSGTGYDYISVIISIGSVGVFLSYLLTQVATDYTCWRYSISVFCGLIVLILRYVYELWKESQKNRVIISVISLMFLFMIPLRLEPVVSERATDERDELAYFLEENGLQSGFCDLWHASYIDAVTEGNVHAIPINYSDKGFYQWATRFENWHYEKFNFVVSDTTMPVRNITEETITQEFGAPSDILHFGKYDIYIYDYDISTKIVWEDNLTDAQFAVEKRKMNAKDSIEYINTSNNDKGDFYLKNGSGIKGPEISLLPGTYTLVISGKNLQALEVNYPLLDDVEYELVNNNNNQIKLSFVLQRETIGRLFEIYNSSDEIATYYYYGLDINPDQMIWEAKNQDIHYLGDCILEEGAALLKNSAIQYGPYVSLKKGRYCLTIYGRNLESIDYDINYDYGKSSIEKEEIFHDETKIIYEFSLNNDYENIEFVCENNSIDAISFFCFFVDRINR